MQETMQGGEWRAIRRTVGRGLVMWTLLAAWGYLAGAIPLQAAPAAVDSSSGELNVATDNTISAISNTFPISSEASTPQSPGTHAEPAGDNAVTTPHLATNVIPEITYHHQDLNGNLVARTTSTGVVTWRAEVRPFAQGEATSPDAARYFLDEPRLDEIGEEGGIYHLGARFYDPLSGRFLSLDPLPINAVNRNDPQRFNRYSYALNNPFRYEDPSGLAPDKNAPPKARSGNVTGWDMVKWVVGTIDWSTGNPVAPSGIAGLALDSIGLFAKESGRKDIENTADLAGKGLSLYGIASSGTMSWVGGVMMYLEAWAQLLDASSKLHTALKDPNATNGLGSAADYSRYSLEQVKAWCQQNRSAACYNFAARGGDVDTLQFQEKKEKSLEFWPFAEQEK